MCSSSVLTAAFIRISPEKVTRNIQRGSAGDPVGRLYPTLCVGLWGSPQLAENFSAAAAVLYFSDRRTAAWRVLPERKRSRAQDGELSDEAHLPAKEAKAGPRPRLPQTHELAGRTADAQATARQGTQAPLHLSVTGAMTPRSSHRGRLSRSAEFERVYRQGSSTGNRHFVLYAFPN